MKKLTLPLVAALLLLVAVSLVTAQTSDFDIGWHTLDGGGTTSLGGDRFSLAGTIGQPDTQSLSGGVYSLQGGFWKPASTGEWRIYLPLILR